MSQSAAARAIKFKPSAVSKAVAGRVSAEMAEALAPYLGVRAGWLLFGDSDTPGEIREAERRGWVAGLLEAARLATERSAGQVGEFLSGIPNHPPGPPGVQESGG